MKRIITLGILFILIHQSLCAQQMVVKGKIRAGSNQEKMGGVSVMVKGGVEGTKSNEDGSFEITVPSLPVSLIISAIGFETQEITVTSADAGTVTMDISSSVRDQVTLSTARRPTKMLEAHVSYEPINHKQIRHNPSESYYNMAAYKKGVDIIPSSLNFKTISTRGFNGSGSTRVNQMVDGMDNQAPALNFFVGNFAGLTELDVESMEILPGASSALYGPGGINGTILINSKNPFTYQGLSIQLKEGISNVNHPIRPEATAFHDFSFRYAKAINRFAFKVGAQYISATDWLAFDSSNYSRSGTIGKVIPGTRASDPNYDGVNVYGDETHLNFRNINNSGIDLLKAVGNAIKAQYPQLGPGIDAVVGLSTNMNVSRTGFNEVDMIDPETKNIKLSGALHYKLTDKTEAQLMGYWATGNSVYTGNNRYVLNGIKIGQFKAEVRNPNWFLRAYTTQENAGDSYSATIVGQYMNEGWKKSGTWAQQYSAAYLVPAATTWLTTYASQGAAAANAAVLANMPLYHTSGRKAADNGIPVPGSAQFSRLLDSVKSIPIPKGGLFQETSQLWMTEGQYHFSQLEKYADIIVGANWKRYILNSEGTLFIDTAGPITINEIGAYAQVIRKLFHERLSLSFSGRVDKNEDFKTRFTPRATALFALAKDHNLRFSYQTAYRFPSTQQKYIRLDVGSYTLLGGLPWIMNYMEADKKPVYELNGNVPSANPYVYKELKPESMQSFEVGYKALINERLLIDAYGYWGTYTDFLGRNVLLQMSTGKVFSTVVNSTVEVKTHGFGLGMDYKMKKNYNLFFNAYSDVLTNVPSGFQAYFNTPKYRLNAGFGNTGIGKKNKIGFNAAVHWQDDFEWEGELANGPVESYTSIDAQVNYQVVKYRTMIKLGGTNVTNHYYKPAYGNPTIGALYYVSLGYNF